MQLGEPLVHLDLALEVRRQHGAEPTHGGRKFLQQRANLVVGEHVEFDGVHSGDEALDALGNGGGGGRGGGRPGGRRRCGGAELDGGRDSRLEEAVERGGAVEAVRLDESRDGDDAGERGGEGVELGDELEALGLVVGGGDEVADVGALHLLRGPDDGVQVRVALQELPLSLVVPQLRLHRRRRALPRSLPSLSGGRIAGARVPGRAGLGKMEDGGSTFTRKLLWMRRAVTFSIPMAILHAAA
jgi:hypothetical protein